MREAQVRDRTSTPRQSERCQSPISVFPLYTFVVPAVEGIDLHYAEKTPIKPSTPEG